MLVVRASVPVETIAPSVMAAVREADPAMPLTSARSLAAFRADTLAVPRAGAGLVGGFAFVALALTLIGVYGVTSFGVEQRRREIGVRMALGARPRDVRRLVLSDGLAPVAAGILVGLAVARIGARLLQSWVYGIGVTDAVTFTGASAILFVVAWLACVAPARRASRVDPVVALRD